MRHARQLSSFQRSVRLAAGIATAVAGLAAIATSIELAEDPVATIQPSPMQLRTAQRAPLALTAVIPAQTIELFANEDEEPLINAGLLIPPPALALLMPRTIDRPAELSV